MATHSSVLDWRIPGIGEPGGLPSMGSHSRTQLKQLSSFQHLSLNWTVTSPIKSSPTSLWFLKRTRGWDSYYLTLSVIQQIAANCLPRMCSEYDANLPSRSLASGHTLAASCSCSHVTPLPLDQTPCGHCVPTDLCICQMLHMSWSGLKGGFSQVWWICSPSGSSEREEDWRRRNLEQSGWPQSIGSRGRDGRLKWKAVVVKTR